jgi:hypothetical protein
MKPVQVLISYAPSRENARMLYICLDNLYRYTPYESIDVSVLYDAKVGWDEERDGEVIKEFPVWLQPCSVKGDTPSKKHGSMLDFAIPIVNAADHDHVLTLDSDCFPIRSAWLDEMLEMAKSAAVVGIRQPWQPDDIGGAIEKRLAEGLAYRNTHVACQLVRLDFLKEHNLKYSDGDDTGFAIPAKAHEVGAGVDGWMPTCCAWPDVNRVGYPEKDSGTSMAMNPELNREACMVWGDCVYHHGGSSRPDVPALWPFKHFEKARATIRWAGGAAHLRQCGYQFKFDQEHMAWGTKVEFMRKVMTEYLKHGKTLFKR